MTIYMTTRGDFNIERIEKSFEQIAPRLDEMTMLFFDDLFASHPQLRPFFSEVDLVAQRRKLAAMLTLIVTNLRRMDVLATALRTLGARHIGYGATAESYVWVEQSLLKSLEGVSGDFWDEETGRAWSVAMGIISQQMLAGADGSRAVSAGSDGDIDVLMELAANPALSFQRNSLFSSYIEKKKSDHEYGLARGVQQELLPGDLPDIQGYHRGKLSAGDAGRGDYYDWIMPEPGYLCLALGDVSGKGIQGAMIMCRLFGAFRALLAVERDVVSAVSAINCHMSERMPVGRFITFAMLNVDLNLHTYRFVSAGHNPPLLRKADGSVSFVGDKATGIPLGIDKNSDYDEIDRVFEPGDQFLLYTDEVDAAMDLSGEMYGRERLRDYFRACPFTVTAFMADSYVGKDLI